MRISSVLLLSGAAVLAGCVRSQETANGPQFAPVPLPRAEAAASPAPVQTTPPPSPAPAPDQKVIVTPGESLVGKVARVNPNARFVVLSFALGHMPRQDQTMSLYRQGLQVGEVKVTGPQYDENVVADVVSGEAQVGDEAREH